MLPFFFRHYEQFAERIFVYDNMSTDASCKLLKDHPKVTYYKVNTNGQIDHSFYLRVKNDEWKKHSLNVDWVIVVDIDEFLYHSDLLTLLTHYKSIGTNFPKTNGYNMVANDYPSPATNEQIYEILKNGVAASNMNKFCIFDPKQIWPRYFPGAHNTRPCPRENLKMSETIDLKVLHYKYMNVDTMVNRYATLAKRRSAIYNKLGLSVHYTQTEEEVRALFLRQINDAKQVI